MPRRKRPEEHENHERWLVSYADFITLLFAFFVVMYAISSVNEGKYRTLSHSLTAAFQHASRSIEPIQVGELARTRQQMPLAIEEIPRNMPLPEQMMTRDDLPVGEGEGDAALQQALDTMADQILTRMAPLIQDELMTVRRTELWLELEMNTSVLFPSGSEELSAQSQAILTELAGILRPFPNPIRVEGFTDDIPINTRRYVSNWELSAARAARVVRLFAEAGVEPGRMAAVAFGEHRPIADNRTAEGRGQNRRVALVVLANHDSRYLMDINREQSTVRLPGPPGRPGGSTTAPGESGQ